MHLLCNPVRMFNVRGLVEQSSSLPHDRTQTNLHGVAQGDEGMNGQAEGSPSEADEPGGIPE